MKPRVE